MRLLTILAAWALALTAQAATLPATPATLAAVVSKAAPGDTVNLAPGAYGDALFRNLKFSPAVTIQGAPGAVFRSFGMVGVTGLHLDHLTVTFTPTAATKAWDMAVRIDTASDIAVTNSTITGAPSVNGVAETAAVLDATQNVIGRPTALGLQVTHSDHVTLTGNECSQFERCVSMLYASDVLIQANHFHDTRRTPLAGAALQRVTIDGNTLYGVHPWRWGLPNGDHGDLMAFWSDAAQTFPSAGVRITGNLAYQVDGPDVLGMWFQGTAAEPFTGFEISRNVFLVANLQGIMLTHSQDGLIANNYLVAPLRPVVDTPQRPTVLLLAGVTGVAVNDNLVNRVVSDTSGGKNTQSGNTMLAGQVAASKP